MKLVFIILIIWQSPVLKINKLMKQNNKKSINNFPLSLNKLDFLTNFALLLQRNTYSLTKS